MKKTLKAILRAILIILYVLGCIFLFLFITFYDPAKNYLLHTIKYLTDMGFFGYYLIATFGVLWMILCCPVTIFE